MMIHTALFRLSAPVFVLLAAGAAARTLHVDPAGGAYRTPAAAAAEASAGDVIELAPGVYGSGAQTAEDGIRSRVRIPAGVTLRSREGAEVTVIDGAREVRGVRMMSGSRLIGITVRNGTASAGPEAPVTARSGGGVYAAEDARILDCVIVSNAAGMYGGGIYGGGIERTILRDNHARRGGGAAYAELINSVLYANRAEHFGGGAYRCDGVHCTVAGNIAEFGAGGVFEGTWENSIVMYNRGAHGSRNSLWAAFVYSCSDPLPRGKGNIDEAPGFLDPAQRDYRLIYPSPCIDRGAFRDRVMEDCNGTPRPLDGNNDGVADHDMGAYEYLHPSADTDNDGVRDRVEWGAEQ
ncbi:right-handed parallel beta-helix repeat-containing protein [Kiritimatiella glycovorans]|uniref:Right handed beta helix domain-containing protein n=1 Tax=Kiritimatiella glycovorans TaxID=1307763 RepID=A0A0G3EKC4_9BACT|nr:right-handed parallel beta-helix repeat-containing protein [Kiritimatiella glycovorans]AKJ65270.1 hypothetical protein L21SP4_02037 [Kiritimatiella glycovorans]